MKTLLASLYALTLLLLPVALLAQAQEGEHCQIPDSVTNDFFFSASSTQGAVGDIVPVDLYLTVERYRSDHLVSAIVTCCFDPESLELVGAPVLSPEVDAALYITYAFPLQHGHNGVDHLSGEHGFILGGDFADDRPEIFPLGTAVHFATAHFRVLGDVGDTAWVRFCDDEFRLISGSCQYSYLYWRRGESTDAQIEVVRSERHVDAPVRILEGEPQNTEIPELPPAARVYPEAPTPETGEFLFELAGGVGVPGGQVALPIWITSSHEFAGFAVALQFPSELVRVVAVEEHVRPGLVRIDNDAGFFGMYLRDSVRRIGREGERVQVATAHVEILQAAAGLRTVDFAFGESGPWMNWVGVRHTRGLGSDGASIVAEVAPTYVASPLLRVQSEPTWAGDVDLDYEVTLTDAVITLGDLFLGQDGTVCTEAADFDRDGRVLLSDAVGVLNHLFRAGPAPSPTPDVYCD